MKIHKIQNVINQYIINFKSKQQVGKNCNSLINIERVKPNNKHNVGLQLKVGWNFNQKT